MHAAEHQHASSESTRSPAVIDAHGRSVETPQVSKAPRRTEHQEWPRSAKLTTGSLCALSAALSVIVVRNHALGSTRVSLASASIAEAASAVGASCALWFGFHEHRIKRRRSREERAERAEREASLSAALRHSIRVERATCCLIDSPMYATSDETQAIASWTEEQRIRGWRADGEVWRKSGHAPQTTVELLSSTDRRLIVLPWIMMINFRNCSGERVMVGGLTARLTSGAPVELLLATELLAPDEARAVRLTSPTGAPLAFATAAEATTAVAEVLPRVLDSAGREVETVSTVIPADSNGEGIPWPWTKRFRNLRR
jgi:hypothetical protein